LKRKPPPLRCAGQITPGSHDPAAERARTEGDEHLMMPHSLAALDQPEVADDAIRPAAHAGELRTLKMFAHTRQHECNMHHASIPSILTPTESTRRNAKPSKRSVAAALADAMYLRGPDRHALQYFTPVVHARARRIRLRKAFQYLDTDFLCDRTFDLAHAIPEPDDFPLLLDIHWPPPSDDQREHIKNNTASLNL
jgi:hypothetical protein